MNSPSTVVNEPKKMIKTIPRRGISARKSEITKTIIFSGTARFSLDYPEQTSRKSWSFAETVRLRALIAPIADFLEAFATALLEQPHPMAEVLEFMNVSPYFGLPVLVVNCGLAAGGAAGMKLADDGPGRRRRGTGQLDEDAAYFLNIFVGVDDVLVAQQKPKSKLLGFRLGLGAGLKRTVLR
jgi:hypothetical protein